MSKLRRRHSVMSTAGFWGRGCCSGASLEAPALVSGLDDVAVVREAVEEGGGHLGIAEDARPFAEGEVGGDDYRGALVEPADQVEQQLAARLGEGQVAELVEDDEVEAGEVRGGLASLNRIRAIAEWMSVLFMPRPGLAAAG